MAYQKTGTPRFYINLLEWMSVNRLPGGAEGSEPYYPRIYDSDDHMSDSFKEIFRTYPRLAEAVEHFGVDLIQQTEDREFSNYNLLDHGEGGNGFIAFLGHKFGDGDGVKYKLSGSYDLFGIAAPPEEEEEEEEVEVDPYEDYIWCYISSFVEQYGFNYFTTPQSCMNGGGIEVPNRYYVPEFAWCYISEYYEANGTNLYTGMLDCGNQGGEIVPYADYVPGEDNFVWCWISSYYEQQGQNQWLLESICDNYGGVVVPSQDHNYAENTSFTRLLTRGWNMIGTPVLPEWRTLVSDPVNENDILAPMISRDTFLRMISESGSSIEYISFLGEWANGIGGIEIGEGYYIRVKEHENITFEGAPAMLDHSMENPYKLQLKLGWNMISTPLFESIDSMMFFELLINGGWDGDQWLYPRTLLRVIAQSGSSIEYISFLDEWGIGIETIDPGFGYYVRVNRACTLSIYPPEYYNRARYDLRRQYDNVQLGEGLHSRFISNPNSKRRKTWGGTSVSRSLVPINLTELVNAMPDGVEWSCPNYNGFSISSFNGIGVGNIEIDLTYEGDGLDSNNSCQSIVVGAFYDMPHSPELSLTMHREMEGVHKKKGLGGNEFIDYSYTKSRDWNGAPAWELYQGEGSDLSDTNPFAKPQISEKLKDLSKIGRRIWELEFNYLSDTDIFTDISSLTNYETVSPSGETFSEGDSVSENTLTQQSRFFSHVLHKTNGGQLPFIFQPDNENFNPDNFAICKFDMNTFEYEQVANGVYNIKVQIKEVW